MAEEERSTKKSEPNPVASKWKFEDSDEQDQKKILRHQEEEGKLYKNDPRYQREIRAEANKLNKEYDEWKKTHGTDTPVAEATDDKEDEKREEKTEFDLESGENKIDYLNRVLEKYANDWSKYVSAQVLGGSAEQPKSALTDEKIAEIKKNYEEAEGKDDWEVVYRTRVSFFEQKNYSKVIANLQEAAARIELENSESQRGQNMVESVGFNSQDYVKRMIEAVKTGVPAEIPAKEPYKDKKGNIRTTLKMRLSTSLPPGAETKDLTSVSDMKGDGKDKTLENQHNATGSTFYNASDVADHVRYGKIASSIEAHEKMRDALDSSDDKRFDSEYAKTYLGKDYGQGQSYFDAEHLSDEEKKKRTGYDKGYAINAWGGPDEDAKLISTGDVFSAILISEEKGKERAKAAEDKTVYHEVFEDDSEETFDDPEDEDENKDESSKEEVIDDEENEGDEKTELSDEEKKEKTIQQLNDEFDKKLKESRFVEYASDDKMYEYISKVGKNLQEKGLIEDGDVNAEKWSKHYNANLVLTDAGRRQLLKFSLLYENGEKGFDVEKFLDWACNNGATVQPTAKEAAPNPAANAKPNASNDSKKDSTQEQIQSEEVKKLIDEPEQKILKDLLSTYKGKYTPPKGASIDDIKAIAGDIMIVIDEYMTRLNSGTPEADLYEVVAQQILPKIHKLALDYNKSIEDTQYNLKVMANGKATADRKAEQYAKYM